MACIGEFLHHFVSATSFNLCETEYREMCMCRLDNLLQWKIRKCCFNSSICLTQIVEYSNTWLLVERVAVLDDADLNWPFSDLYTCSNTT